MAALEGCESVADTVVVPPFSGIEEDASASATVGASSSSMMVSVLAAGFATPLAPLTVAETVTDLFGESVASSVAEIVTVPVLAVDPAATVSVFAVESEKPSPEAAIVSVTAALDAPESVAVTVDTPPFSEIKAGDRARVAVGAPSSSVRVRLAPLTAPMPWPLDAEPVTVTERLFALSMASFTAVTVTVSPAFVVLPAAITIRASWPTV